MQQCHAVAAALQYMQCLLLPPAIGDSNVKQKPAGTLQQMEAVERRETVYGQEMVRELAVMAYWLTALH